jgi:BlaI family transcriptional regulator, penicillinase repressor
MARNPLPTLSRRESQIMDIIYQRGEATAAEVHAALADPPSYSTVRTLLRVLKEKGHVQQREEGPRYVFSPTVSRQKAKRWALERIVSTFFEGSAEAAMATLLDLRSTRLSGEELARLEAMIRQAKEKETSGGTNS